MSKLLKRQLAEVLPDLPVVMTYEPGDGEEHDGLFLCALGFEPRCLNIPMKLAEAGYKARRAVYFRYSTNLDDNAANLAPLEAALSKVSDNVEPLETDAADLPGRLRRLLELVVSEAGGGAARVTIDTSVTASRLLLRCMKVLFEHSVELRVVYSEAAVYHPTRTEYEGDPGRWDKDGLLGLEQGVGDVVPSKDHPGHALDALPDCVVLFPSFKGERSKAVMSFVDPSLLSHPGKKVVWMIGVPHLAEDEWRRDAMRRINGIGDGACVHEVSTFDYQDTLRALESVYQEMARDYRVTVSPLGSKMQGLGIALFCYMHPDVRVILSIPKEYNAAQYSKGCKALWQVPFGNVDRVRAALDSVGMLRVEE